jgi:hypothetical protein
MTVTAPPALHVPDEPVARAATWLAAVQEGAAFDEVLTAPDGLVAWLWSRWSALGRTGMDPEEFGRIVLGYRRELWLWLAGERTWTQACSGLVGRLARRIAPDDPAAG